MYNSIKLPSGRTLSDYKNFNKPESGWKSQNIQAMKEIFHKACLPNRALIGGLFFDEVKIKEDLVWDPSFWEIIGFTDLGTEDSLEDDNDNHLATHILQFHFKSLFHNFSYPCAYFLTRNITADKLNRIFWLGVSMLQLQKFDIIVACCDGASENRKFINMNITKDKLASCQCSTRERFQ